MKRRLNRHIKGLFSFGVLLMFLLTSINSIAQVKKDPPLIHAGKVNILNHNFDLAINKLSQHLKIFGYSEEAYYWRAHALIQLKRIDDAMVDLRLVLQRDPNDDRAMDALGYAYNQKGNYLTAIKWFNEAIERDNKNAIYYNNRGMSYYYLDKYNTAFFDFNKAIQLDSTFAQAYSNRGSARYNHQDIKEASDLDLTRAENDFTIALEKDNKLLSAYRNRGLVRLEMEKYRESFLDFQKAIYLDPTDPLIYFHVGNLMFAKEQYADAINYYIQSINLKANQIEVLYQRAKTYEILNQLDLARYDYEVIIQHRPNEKAKCYYRIARTYTLENDAQHAYYYLNQARKEGLFKESRFKPIVFNDKVFSKYWDADDFAKLKIKIEKN